MEGRLLVQGVPVEGGQARRDVDGVPPQEDGRGGIYTDISPCAVGGPQSAAGVRGPVSLAGQQVLACMKHSHSVQTDDSDVTQPLNSQNG